MDDITNENSQLQEDITSVQIELSLHKRVNSTIGVVSNLNSDEELETEEEIFHHDRGNSMEESMIYNHTEIPRLSL